jgi:hypothetical protein
VNAQQKALKEYGPQSAEFEQDLAVAENYWARLQEVSKARGKKNDNQSQKKRAFGR